MKRQMLSLVCGILNHGTHKSREQSDVLQRAAEGSYWEDDSERTQASDRRNKFYVFKMSIAQCGEYI
jgi:hypothetical protein